MKSAATRPGAQAETRRGARISFTRFMVVAFGSITVLAVVIEAVVALGIARENTEELLHDKATTLLDGIERRVDGVLRPVAAQGQSMARMAAGAPSLDDPRTAAFAIGTMNATRQVSRLMLLKPDEGAAVFARGKDGIGAERAIIDASAAAMIDEARTRGQAYWRPPQWRDGGIVLTHVSPAFDDTGALFGVLAQEVSGSSLSRAIVGATGRSEQQTPFILHGQRSVIAHPLLIRGNLSLPRNREGLPDKNSLGDAVLEQIWGRDELRLVKLEPLKGDVIKGVSFGDRAFLFVFRTSVRYSAEPWVIGAYLDGSRTRNQVRRIAGTAVAGALIVIAAILAAVYIGRRVSAPAIRLASAAMLVREERLDEVPTLPPTRLREFDEASVSFNRMVDGLRERNVIRDLFGKFVPTSVAADLLHSPGGLAPQVAEATILFVDMRGFTALTERVQPEVLVPLLNAYFSDLVEIIERHEGVVTQFQGDAILAVFNVPRPVDDHRQRAVAAARAMTAKVAQTRYEGEQLACRIGIATGSVVAGNVGALGRMNYTVHGDAVNLASRLERLNKTMDTTVLIAETTALGAPDEGLAEVGTVEVRGRRQTTRLYTFAP